MFNAIETRDRLEEDAVEHGNEMPPEADHTTDEKISHMLVEYNIIIIRRKTLFIAY